MSPLLLLPVSRRQAADAFMLSQVRRRFGDEMVKVESRVTLAVSFFFFLKKGFPDKSVHSGTRTRENEEKNRSKLDQ